MIKVNLVDLILIESNGVSFPPQSVFILKGPAPVREKQCPMFVSVRSTDCC